MNHWHDRYVAVATLAASWSKDPTTKVGAVIYNPETRAILSMGYNGLPRNVQDTEARMERPLKYLYTEHAERNAIYNAARHGVALEGMGLALGWFPCADCARAIIQSGIKELVSSSPDYSNERWRDSFLASVMMLSCAGITMHTIGVE